MNEIYWLTRLDSISAVSLTLLITSVAISALVIVIYLVANGQKIYDESRGYESSVKENKGYCETCKNILKYSIPISIISCLLVVFVPTTKEGLLIYGVGGTVDYIKNNPTAKQIPDKCINALDKWVTSLGEEKSDTTNNGKD